MFKTNSSPVKKLIPISRQRQVSSPLINSERGRRRAAQGQPLLNEHGKKSSIIRDGAINSAWRRTSTTLIDLPWQNLYQRILFYLLSADIVLDIPLLISQ